jgi:hypothetical protein
MVVSNWIGQVICYLDLLSFDDFFREKNPAGCPLKNKVANEKKF